MQCNTNKYFKLHCQTVFYKGQFKPDTTNVFQLELMFWVKMNPFVIDMRHHNRNCEATINLWVSSLQGS